LQGNGTSTATASFSLFDYPYVSASVNYNIIAFPYSLGPGHRFTSSVFNRTQTITKNVAATAARTINLTSTAYTVTYDSDGQVINPTDGITLVATAFNTTGSKFYQFFKDDVAQTPIQTTATKNVAPEDAVAAGEVATWKVTLRDGSNSASAPIRAQASVTIAGIKDGTKAYNAVVNPENTSIVYKVSGETEAFNTSATITATKGGEALTHRPSGFSTQTQDPFGNNIGSLGEYQVTIHSKSGHITLGDGKVSGSVLNGSTNATIGNVASWVNPEGNPTGQIVYRINFENGKQITFKTQSIAIQYEGATGPGIVMRGVWNQTTNYIGSVETTNFRRDAVIWPDPGNSGGNTRYYAAISGSGPATNDGQGNPVGYQEPIYSPSPVDSAWWQYLGDQEFFVAAKIAIFDESFVKNTINIGNNAGSPFANIVLAGGRDDPYMAIGQNGTVGGNDIQYDPSTYPTIIGYDKIGIFAGMYNNASVYEPRFSLRGSSGNYLRWDGDSLDINGAINASSGNFSGFVTAGGVQLGVGVTNPAGGVANGIFINSNNYWLDNAGTVTFKAGGASNYINWDGSSTLSVVGDITATSGFVSNLFTVGSSAASRIFLDAQTTTRKIYIGAGNFDNNDTTFYVDTTGKFSLGNRFKYETTTSGFGSFITANSIMYVSDIRASQVSFDFGLPAPDGAGFGFFVSSGFVFGGGGGYNASVDFRGTSADAYFDKTGAFTIENINVTGGTISGISSLGVSGNTTISGTLGSGNLTVTGAITATGNITAFFSDDRLKTKLGNIDNAINKISQLNGFYYTTNTLANSFGYTDTKTQLGLSAQEVQSVFPNIVSLAPFDMKENTMDESKSGENYLTIDYSKIVPVLVEAIKELKAEIEELKRNK
jgi:hypothetical protein